MVRSDFMVVFKVSVMYVSTVFPELAVSLLVVLAGNVVISLGSSPVSLCGSSLAVDYSFNHLWLHLVTVECFFIYSVLHMHLFTGSSF